jgi:hypothetical protein
MNIQYMYMFLMQSIIINTTTADQEVRTGGLERRSGQEAGIEGQDRRTGQEVRTRGQDKRTGQEDRTGGQA